MPRIPGTNIRVGPHHGYGHVNPGRVAYRPAYVKPVHINSHRVGPSRGQMVANDIKNAGHHVGNAMHNAVHGGKKVYY